MPNTEDLKEELTTCLALQHECDAKVKELVKRYAAIVKAHRDEHIIVEIDGTLYELRKGDHTSWAVELCRELNGFFHDYHLEPLPKPF